MSCFIVGSGASLPERVVTNAQLAPMLGVSAKWIENNSGIRERRWVETHQSTSDLAAAALTDALHDAGLNAEQLDYLIGGTISPDYQVPGIAPLTLRKLLNARQIPALDIRVGCVNILYALQIARALIETRAANNVACFGAEAQSKGLDLSAKSAEISMLFGDGAGALIVSREPINHSSLRVDDVLIRSDGSFAEDLCVRATGTAGARWIDREEISDGMHYTVMNGRTVILQAVRKLSDAAIEIATHNRLTLDDIDLVIPHQANANLLKQVSKRLGIAEDRVVMNLDRYGNTSGASAFIALEEARRKQRMHPGARLMVLAFGAGFTWGAALLTSSSEN
ncbi:MAG TPA: ketoacyl-ACP synthase III [Blastocatellia bacterium]|nr:ketoacyl-ACP synthase III [Blastocatellia bacterium]